MQNNQKHLRERFFIFSVFIMVVSAFPQANAIWVVKTPDENDLDNLCLVCSANPNANKKTLPYICEEGSFQQDNSDLKCYSSRTTSSGEETSFPIGLTSPEDASKCYSCVLYGNTSSKYYCIDGKYNAKKESCLKS